MMTKENLSPGQLKKLDKLLTLPEKVTGIAKTDIPNEDVLKIGRLLLTITNEKHLPSQFTFIKKKFVIEEKIIGDDFIAKIVMQVSKNADNIKVSLKYNDSYIEQDFAPDMLYVAVKYYQTAIFESRKSKKSGN